MPEETHQTDLCEALARANPSFEGMNYAIKQTIKELNKPKPYDQQ